MAEALLIPAANGILNGLLSQATNQINLAWGFKENLQNLYEKLEIIQALLHDAEKKDIALDVMTVWLKKLKAATCKAENVLDEVAYEALRRSVENRISNKVCDLFTLSDPLSFCVKMANKVNKVNLLLDNICGTATKIGLNPVLVINDAIVKPRVLRTSLPFIDDTQVVGRDGDVSKVVEMLLHSNIETELPVTAIVGMPGIGKTTLAQVVYKKMEILNSFGERMWICVSDNFKVERILNEMVESLTGEKSETQNIEGVVRKLGEKLKGKKYLLVLDDVWNENPNLWVDLRNSLIGIGGSKESKILFTTRSTEVVLATKQTFQPLTHELTRLSEEYCLTLFRKRAFADGGPRETQTLLDMGRRMVQKCKGVPLAINSLGGLLYSKHDEQEWESIQESETWSLLANEEGITSVLRLSFDHLTPPSLKEAFAFCSFFQKHYKLVKDELIQYWMGLGYLESSKTKGEMEELGNEYFEKLLRNSLFQEVEFDEYNNITWCKMHDLVRDLALHVSQGSFIRLKEGEVIKKYTNVQHLVLSLTKETRLEISKENVQKLRRIVLQGHFPQNFEDFKCIRTLRLETIPGNEPCFKELHSSIRKFIHLKILDLTMTSIKKVPNFVTKLYNLETLKLPKNVEELPKDFHHMVRLRHFDLEVSDQNRKLMPMKIGQLTSLRTLPFFSVGKKSGHRIEELGSLSKLKGRLHVYGLQHVKDKEQAETAQILSKSDIQELQFHWDNNLIESDNNHGDVLQGLKPHQNVKGLILRNFGGRRWASWMNRDACLLQKLVKIELINCRLCEQLPALGHLPHLSILTVDGLHNLKCIGPEFYGQDELIIDNCGRREAAAPVVFPTLRILAFLDMPQLEEWSDAMDTIHSFPCLKEIRIESCPKLTTIPAFEGSTSLQKLWIGECMELTCLPEGILQPTLVEIRLKHCSKLKLSPNDEIEAAFNRLTSLKKLRIDNLQELMYLPKGLIQPTLIEIFILNCPKLETLINPIDETEAAFNGLTMTSLQELLIINCPDLMCLPKWLLQPTLQNLFLSYCPKLEIANPDSLRSLASLKCLAIFGCPKWGSCWEEGLVCTTSVISLSIGVFGGEYRHLPWPSASPASEPCGRLASVKFLNVFGWPELESLPEQLAHLPALKFLTISHFTGSESLPEWLRDLPLEGLQIFFCPLLQERCKKTSGEDWLKIAHIPYITIDDSIIQNLTVIHPWVTIAEFRGQNL